MKKIITIILLLFPLVVKAECTNKELTRLKALAGHITSYYDYNDNNTFTATIENVHSDLYLKDITNNNEYRTTKEGINEIIIPNLQPGKTVTLKINSSKGECSTRTVFTIYLTIPHYNKYFNDPICNNNNNSLCSKWANTSSLSYEQFVEQVKNTIEEPIKEEKEKEENIKNYRFLDFLADYYIYILLTIIITGSFAIYKLDKKSKFDF